MASGTVTVTCIIDQRCSKVSFRKMQFNEGLTPAQATAATATHISEQDERWLLACVYAESGSNNLLVIEGEAQKYLVLVTLALVECVADASLQVVELGYLHPTRSAG